MKNTAEFSCSISTTDASTPLNIEVWLDNDLIFKSNSITDSVNLVHNFNDTAGAHELKFIMSGKTWAHTLVNDQGQIVKDSCLTVTGVAFDGIELNQVFADHAVYQHDFNGTAEPVTTGFFGHLGCNGTVSFKFSNPFHLWLLDNM